MGQRHVQLRIKFMQKSTRGAMIELKKGSPEVSLDWLDCIQRCGRWSDLAQCYASKEQDPSPSWVRLSSRLHGNSSSIARTSDAVEASESYTPYGEATTEPEKANGEAIWYGAAGAGSS